MSTRCNIRLIEDNKVKCILYRHSDGYPECTGKDILSVIDRKLMYIENIANTLLKRTREDGDFAGKYEWSSQLHGDIEYMYDIRFRSGEPSYCKLECYEVPFCEERSEDEESFFMKLNLLHMSDVMIYSKHIKLVMEK